MTTPSDPEVTVSVLDQVLADLAAESRGAGGDGRRTWTTPAGVRRPRPPAGTSRPRSPTSPGPTRWPRRPRRTRRPGTRSCWPRSPTRRGTSTPRRSPPEPSSPRRCWTGGGRPAQPWSRRCASYPAGQKMPWFGPPMSPTSMATARFMETWAHGLDVADALGITPERTDRVRQVAHLGVRTRNFAFATHGLDAPAEEFRIELVAPSGDLWVWGPEDAAQRVTGSAYDFCLRVTQRRHRDDLDLRATGPDADRWLDLAQAFAGPPGEGRSPHERHPARRQLQRLLRRPSLRHARAARRRLAGPAARRDHRRLPRRADHADPGQGPAQGPCARVRPHLRPAGLRLPRARPREGGPDRRERRRSQPRRTGRQARGGGGRAGPQPTDRLGRRRQPRSPERPSSASRAP